MTGEISATSGRTTRERLVAAAAALIPEVGWDNVSARLVAARAGVKPGVVHYHVASMGELRRVATTQTIETFLQRPMSEALAETDPRAGIGILFQRLSAIDAHDPELLLLYESLVAASRDHQLRAEIARSLAELRRQLTNWLDECGTADPTAAAVTITATVDGFLLQRALDPALDPAPLVDGLRLLLQPTDGEP